MKDIEKLQEELNDLFVSAQAKKLCKTKKEFAQLLEMSNQNLSSAFNGNEKALTESLIDRIKAKLAEKGTDIRGDQQRSEDLRYIIDKLTNEMAEQRKEMAEQRKSFERMVFAALGKNPADYQIPDTNTPEKQ